MYASLQNAEEEVATTPEHLEIDESGDAGAPSSQKARARKVALVFALVVGFGAVVTLVHTVSRISIRSDHVERASEKFGAPCATTPSPCATTAGAPAPVATTVIATAPVAPAPVVTTAGATALGATTAGATAGAAEEVDDLVEILEQAAEIEKDQKPGAGARSLEQAKRISSELRGSKLQGAAAQNKVLVKEHDAIQNALEEVSEAMEPEVANDQNKLVTLDIIQKLNGLSETPEKASKVDKGDRVQGDMVFDVDDAQQNNTAASARRLGMSGTPWPNPSMIPYCFSSSIASSSKRAFLHAIAHFQNMVPCFGFKEVGVYDEYKGHCAEVGIFVQSKDSGCYAYVGYPWVKNGWQIGKSTHNLQPNGCDTMGIAAHELGHNLGMAHEQSRLDSYKYVKIIWQNIKPDYRDQYELDQDGDTKQAYDIMSLMHYSDTEFGYQGYKTMKPVRSTHKQMGNRMGLTQADAWQLADTYGCSSTSFKVCTRKMDSCLKEDCVCHQDPAATSPMIKVVDKNGCKWCQRACPDDGYCYKDCGCGVGYRKKQCNGLSAGWVTCEEAPTPPSPPKSSLLNGAAAGNGNKCWAYYQDTWCYVVKADGTYERDPKKCDSYNGHKPDDWCFNPKELRKAKASFGGYCYAYYGEEDGEEYCYLKRSSGKYAMKKDIDCADYNREGIKWCYGS